MFKARNCDVIVLCGLMVLMAAGSSAATPMGRRAQVPLGDLMCRLDKVNKMDAATASQTRNIDCVYQRSRGENLEFYTGTLSIVGSDKQVTDNSMLAWVVRGPANSDSEPGALAQGYAETSDGQALSLAGDKRTSIILIKSSHQSVSKPTHLVTEIQLALQMAPA